MIRKMIGLSALGLLSTSVVAADVEMYGVTHLSVDRVDDGDEDSTYISSNSSRFGIRGQHNIDQSMKVFYQLETGIDLTGEGDLASNNDGNGPSFSAGEVFTTARDSYVGAEFDFGTVRVGNLSALNQWVNDFNLFADQVGDLANIWGYTGEPDTNLFGGLIPTVGIPKRAQSTVQFSSKNYDGLSVSFSWHPEEGQTSQDGYLIKGGFEQSNFKIGLAITKIGTGVGTEDHSANAVTASFDMGDLLVGGGFQTESDVGGTADNDKDSMTLGVKFKMDGQRAVKLQYTTVDVEYNAGALDSDATMIALGFDYKLNKQTTAYAAYANTDNDDGLSFTVNSGGHGNGVVPPIPGEGTNAISFGVVFNFDKAVGK